MITNIFMIENIFHNFDVVSFDEFMKNLKAVRHIGFSYEISVHKTFDHNCVALCKRF